MSYTSGTPKTFRTTFTKSRIIQISSAISLLPLLIRPTAASAGLFTSDEQDKLNEIVAFRKPVSDLLSQMQFIESPNPIGVFVKQRILKGGKEDSDVVLSYLEVYLKPLLTKLRVLAPRLSLDSDVDQKRLQLLVLPSICASFYY